MIALCSMRRSVRNVSSLAECQVSRSTKIQVLSFCSSYSSYEFDLVTDTDIPPDNDGNLTEKPRKKGMNSNYRFIDKFNIEVKAGKGGAGCISYERESNHSSLQSHACSIVYLIFFLLLLLYMG